MLCIKCTDYSVSHELRNAIIFDLKEFASVSDDTRRGLTTNEQIQNIDNSSL